MLKAFQSDIQEHNFKIILAQSESKLLVKILLLFITSASMLGSV